MMDSNCHNTTNNTVEHNQPDGTVDAQSVLLASAAEAYLLYFKARAKQQESQKDAYWHDHAIATMDYLATEPKKRHWWGGLKPRKEPLTLEQTIAEHKSDDLRNYVMSKHFNYVYPWGSYSVHPRVTPMMFKSLAFKQRSEAKCALGLARSNPDGTVHITDELAWLFTDDWTQLTEAIA